jgi:hypothetical protein
VRDQTGHIASQRHQRVFGRKAGGRIVHPLVESLGEVLEVGQHQLVLAREVAVEQVLPRAGGLDQLVHPDVVDTALVEEPASGAQDPPARGGVLGPRHVTIITDQLVRNRSTRE